MKYVPYLPGFVAVVSGIMALAAPVSLQAKEYSPGVNRTYPSELLWGDTHLHTSLSTDAFSFGNTRLTSEEAFQYAQGKKVISSSGIPAQLSRPLDFLVVSDHAEFFGVLYNIDIKEDVVIASELGGRWNSYIEQGNRRRVVDEFVASADGDKSINANSELISYLWEKSVDIAEQYNRPGTFTTLHGYEWTSIVNGNNLHRVVLFKDDADKVSQTIPFSAIESNDPEDLWSALDEYRKLTDGSVMTIPHNGNLSNGLMFDTKHLNGEPMTVEYAKQRNFYEPLYEITQVKGDSEVHPALSPNDEFADYYNWDAGNILRSAQKQQSMLAGEYGRSALQRGLELEKKLGINPFKLGFIGSTDNHTGLTANDENNFFGKFKGSEPGRERSFNTLGDLAHMWPNSQLAASGYAAVWATENTRHGVFNALSRREVYATTGSRIALRYFAGWDFTHADLDDPRMVENAYAKGVPMGGELSSTKKETRSLSLLISASRDPEGANLARAQVIKGWLSESGLSQEKIYDVEIAYDQTTPHTVNIPDATYENSIGTLAINAVWTDPDFDPSIEAFYYVRIIEIPTPTWLTYDAAYFGFEQKSDAKTIHQERAYGSAIWYSPR